MAVEKKKMAFRLLLLIATQKLVERAIDLFQEENVPVQYQFWAQGTASSEIMDLLGLGSVEKLGLVCELPKPLADELLTKLRKRLHLGAPNTGVAFTVALSGGSGQLFSMIQALQPAPAEAPSEGKELRMTDNNYSMILAVVNQGFSEEVMNAARPAGASGGTVFHSRRIGSAEAMRFWGISVQQEREIVMILARKADKLPIMEAIGKRCGMKSAAHGVVFSVPVDGVVGME